MDELIRAELDRDEKILWAGPPSTVGYARFYAGSRFMFGLFFFGFSIFWFSGALAGVRAGDQISSFFPLFGIPFICVGFYMVISPVIAWMTARKTVYAVTNKRAIRAIFGRRKKIDSTYFAQFADLTKDVESTGVGNVYFTVLRTRTDSDYGRAQANVRPDGFIGIADADRVERLLRQEFHKVLGGKSERAG